MKKNGTQIISSISTSHPRLLRLLLVFILLVPGVSPVMADTLELNQPEQSKTESPPETTVPDGTGDEGEKVPLEEPEIPPEDSSKTPVIDDETNISVPAEGPVVSPENETKTLTTEEITIQPETQSKNSSQDFFNVQGNAVDPETNTQEVPFSVLQSDGTSMTTEIQCINVSTSHPFTEVTAEISITNEKPIYVPTITLENEHEFIESYITVQLFADHRIVSETQLPPMSMILKIKKNTQEQLYPIDRQIFVIHSEPKLLSSFSHTIMKEIFPQYTSGVWEPVTPTKISEDEDYIYYHIETPSYYATFVIVGTELVEIQPYQSGIPEIPWTAIILTVLIATVLLIFILFKTGCVYRVEDDDNSTHKEKIYKDSNQKWSYKIKLATTPPEIALIQSHSLYLSATPRSPQGMTDTIQPSNSTEESEEDPMYL